MNNNLDIMNKISINDLDSFFANTNANLKYISEIKETKVDYTWLNVLEETLPSLDKIIRNPRRFIIQEDDVVIVEKIKKVSLETIKHLSQHCENIQDMEDNGDVVPKKLLNVYKEDTIDLYENRFIYTIVKRLETFIERQLENLNIVSNREILKKVNYKGSTNINNKSINIEVKMEEFDRINLDENFNDIKNRIFSCYEIIKSFRLTPMIKELIGCSLVNPPIRKTNLIQKQPDFQRTYLLWEYLDDFEFNDPKTISYVKEDNTTNEIKDEFTLSYFIDCNAVEESKEYFMKYQDIDSKLYKLINDYIYENDYDIKEFVKKTNIMYENAINNKEHRLSDITEMYKTFIKKHNDTLKNIKEF